MGFEHNCRRQGFYMLGLRTHRLRSLEKVGGGSDVSDLPYDCTSQGPPDGQTSINQILLFICIVDCFVQRFCLCPIDCLVEEFKDFHYVIYRVLHVVCFCFLRFVGPSSRRTIDIVYMYPNAEGMVICL